MTKENWTIEIKPKKKWLDIDLKGIWRYRDLYYMYVKRDIVTVYKQTILGPLWFLIQPIFTTDGRSTTAFILHGRYHAVELFQFRVQRILQCVHGQCGRVRQSLLPPSGRAVVRHHLQPDQVRNTIVVVHCHVSLFLCERSFTACQCRPAVVSVPDISDCIPCHVVGVDRIGADHQIP